MENLWGEEIELPIIDVQKSKKRTKKILNDINNPQEVKKVVTKAAKKKLSLEEILFNIKEEVFRVLGKQKDNVRVIKSKSELTEYLNIAAKNQRLAVDTETNNSLDPITCKLMGLCLYTPGQKQVYVPVNHRNYITKDRLDWQVTEQEIFECLNTFIINNPNCIYLYHNGKFDYEVLKYTCGLDMPITYDSLIGAKVIDENEFSAKLKDQYIAKIDPEQEKYSIDHLFEGVEYADVDPEVFALYAATDSYETDKLFEYQLNILTRPDYSKMYNELVKQVEMPYVKANANMESNGMEVDQVYAARLSAKYHNKLNKIDAQLQQILTDYKPMIDEWLLSPDATSLQKRKQTLKQYERATQSPNFDPNLWTNILGVWYKVSKSKAEQLESSSMVPDDLASPVKAAILIYDILKCPLVSKDADKPRAVGEEEIKELDKKTNLPIFKLILKRREIVKLLTTYIDSIPKLALLWPDGRVRTHFNQYGAKTGRLSSSEPLNFQNIPSDNKEIRLLFKAKDGYKIVGGDYSAQEPRLVAHYSQDENMLNAYLNNKDLYSVIAAQSFDVPYEDCLEFYPEGTEIEFEGQHVICGYKTHQNKAGKNRRNMAKRILLGLLYGRGAASIGEQIDKTKEEAQEIIDKFFKAFPKVYEWIEGVKKFCKENEYVEGLAGRRRRLPDINLPDFTVRYKKKKDDNNVVTEKNFNPFLGCENKVNDELLLKYEQEISKSYGKQRQAIIQRADAEGIEIINNGGFKAEAERQCVNAVVQGGAATLTKTALIAIYNDQRLRDIGAYLINTVHDEILLEVPAENSELCEKYLTEDMINSAKIWVDKVPMKVDTYNVDSWYQDEYKVTVENEYEHLVEGNPKENIPGMSYLDAFNAIANERTEMTREYLYEMLKPSMKNVTYEEVFPN